MNQLCQEQELYIMEQSLAGPNDREGALLFRSVTFSGRAQPSVPTFVKTQDNKRG